ncbi:phage holin family protein [Flavobacterium rivuli]|uniref:phage holin family protein n=1 Tax=Flavobacterium rivuli TaxID=498301 RepID=UPI001461567D|nr:phage holin family protein [Flavobacterium rivuli]
MKFIQSLTVLLFAFLIPVQGILIAVGAAIAIHTVTGIYKSVRLRQSFISRRFADVILKMFVYELVILMLFSIDYFLLSEFFCLWFSVNYFFTKACAMVLIFTEMVSIKENIEQAHGINILKQLREALKRTKDLKDYVFDLTKNS